MPRRPYQKNDPADTEAYVRPYNSLAVEMILSGQNNRSVAGLAQCPERLDRTGSDDFRRSRNTEKQVRRNIPRDRISDIRCYGSRIANTHPGIRQGIAGDGDVRRFFP